MKLDLSLLKRLLVIDHPSKQEWPMLSFIINECYKIGGLEFEIDSHDNIFITKNTTDPEYYPCVVGHMDCVLKNANKGLKIEQGKIFGVDVKTEKQIGLGADDAVGICIAIQLLKEISDLKVCFTTEEEIGFVGAGEATENIGFFYNVSYFVQADRHGSSDLITFTNGIYTASEEWLQEVTPFAVKYGYREEVGLGTDVGVLTEELGLSGVNLSCGYYKEHTNKEYVVISEVQTCLNFMYEIITKIPFDKQYGVVINYYAYNYYRPSYRREPEFDFEFQPESKYLDDSPKDDFYESLPCNTCQTYDCMNCDKYPW